MSNRGVNFHTSIYNALFQNYLQWNKLKAKDNGDLDMDFA